MPPKKRQRLVKPEPEDEESSGDMASGFAEHDQAYSEESQSPQPVNTRRRRESGRPDSTAQTRTENADNGVDSSSAGTGADIGADTEAGRSSANSGIERYEDVVSGIVKLVICLEAAKAPIRKALIYSEVISPLCPTLRPHVVFQAVLGDVQKLLTEGFGMQLTFSADTRRRSDLLNKPDQIIRLYQQDVFSLSNVLPQKFRKVVVRVKSKRERALSGVSLIIAVLLILHGGEVTRVKLETQLLPRMGITEALIGETFDSLISLFIKNQLVAIGRASATEFNAEATDSNERIEMVTLGPRARQEFSVEALRGILRFLFDDHFNEAVFDKSLDKFQQMYLYEPHEAVVPKPLSLESDLPEDDD